MVGVAQSVSGALATLAIVTAAYALSALLTFQLLQPLQNLAFGALPFTISLLHLPHTVRILAAYFLGWRSVAYLFPVSVASVYVTHAQDQGGMTLLALGTLISVVGYVGILSACAIKNLLFPLLPQKKDWIVLLIAGAIASVLNTMGHALLLPVATETGVGYFIGDIGGLFFTLIALIYVFRIFDKKG